jgi:hypothetical protein
MWKCLVDSNELITYEKIKSNMKVRIEARYSDSLWEIYKTYHSVSGDVSFTEEYEAPNRKKALGIISKIKKEVLDEKKIKSIESLRKNLVINVKRNYKELNVEKWAFAVNDEEYNNYVIVRYSDDIEMDVLADEKFKYIETEIIEELNRILGLNDFGKDIIQNIFFFSKKSGFYTCDESTPDVGGKIELDLEFQKD